jgi:protein-S-isoprenylcysteine O-methyltransferase Ste14
MQMNSPERPMDTGGLDSEISGRIISHPSISDCPNHVDHMFARALIAFLALPGMVAFVLPVPIANFIRALPEIALGTILIFALGLLSLLACVREFYLAGKGTLAPWAPPVNLVTSGLYRVTRNPMCLSVLVILLAWLSWCPSTGLAKYTVCVAVAFHLRVVLREEPWLQRTFDNGWTAYSASVPRWLWPPRNMRPR